MIDIKNPAESEKIYFNYVRENRKYLEEVSVPFFTQKTIGEMFRLMKEWYDRFGVKQVWTQEQAFYNLKEIDSETSEAEVEHVFNVDLDKYDDEWKEASITSWIKAKNLERGLINTVEYIKTTPVNMDNIDEVIARSQEIFADTNRLNLDKDLGLDFFDSQSHTFDIRDKIPSPYRYVNTCTGGGYDPKTLIIYAGPANIGKSIFLANDAVAYVNKGYNVAFISAEMADKKVLKRVGANLLDIPIGDYEKKASDPNYIRMRLDQISMMPKGHLQIKEFPTSTLTVPSLEAYLLDLEKTKGYKLQVVVVDYLNILANYRNQNSENMYMKIKQIAEDLRAMGIRNNWLIISATQVNTAGYDNSMPTLNHIAESKGLVHTADMIYAIVQTDEMKDTNTYWLKILKIRDGDGKDNRFQLRIDYSRMKLTDTGEIASPLELTV